MSVCSQLGSRLDHRFQDLRCLIQIAAIQHFASGFGTLCSSQQGISNLQNNGTGMRSNRYDIYSPRVLLALAGRAGIDEPRESDSAHLQIDDD